MKKLLLLFYLLLSAITYSQHNNKVIIKLKDGVTIQDIAVADNHIGVDVIDAVSKKFGATNVKKLGSGKKSNDAVFVITFSEGADVETILANYKQTNTVAYAEPDFNGSGGGVQGIAPNDQYYNRQWGLHNDGSFVYYPAVEGADVDMENAWDIEQGSEDIVLAVMDSGLKMDHPEFAGRLWVNQNEIPGNGIDDDGNGFIDDINGWDFVNDDNNPADDHGHGTNVTGIAAANGNNSIGYSGVDRNCKVMVLKGLNSNNFGDYSWFYEAVIYATDNDADVINLSVGGSSYSSLLHDAINYALDNGVVVVACMMNTNTSIPYYPANYAGVIAVGATDPNDRRTAPFFWDMQSGSCYGSHISVIAPGNYIFGLSHTSNVNYESYWGGTSQSSPLVAGIATLLKAQNPARTPAQIKQIIETTAEDQVGNPAEDTAGFDIYYGHGRVNAFNALSSPLSVAQHNIENNIRVYPNPSQGIINIEITNYPTDISVYNNLGQLILQDKLTAESNTVRLFNKGVYHLVINDGKNKKIEKIIIH